MVQKPKWSARKICSLSSCPIFFFFFNIGVLWLCLMQLMIAKLISFPKIYHPAPEMMDLSINGVPYSCQEWGNAVPRGTLHSAHFPDLERRMHCSLATLGHDVKELLLPTLKVPSSFSQCVSQDGGPHICTLLIVPSLHHISLYLLFFHVIYIYP